MTRVLLVPGMGDTDGARRRLTGLRTRRQLVVQAGPDGLDGLADALDRAAEAREAIAVVSADLVTADDVLLRLLDDPELRVAALVGAMENAHPVATQGSTVLSVGTAVHPVSDADAGFLGALYVAASLVPKAAEALRAAASPAGADPLDTILAVLARDVSLPAMTAVRPQPFPAQRAETPESARAALAAVAAEADPGRAARTAARPGDGFYSTVALRRVSRHITPWAARRGVRPNTVTVASAAVGISGAVCFAVGSYPALVAGALLLQISLVLDCVDGELARATRTRSVFGTWLDAVTDRVKEYAALAGLALAGNHLWELALVAMVLQTARHLQDFSFDKGVLACWRAGMRDTRPLSDTTPWRRPEGAGRGAELLTGSAGMWARRVVRMPIGERWLILSLAALADRPWLGLTGYVVTAVAAESWTVVGALRRTRGAVAHYPANLRRRLADYRDDGLVPLAAPDGILGWALPPLTALVEGAVLLTAVLLAAAHWAASAFGWFAVVAWHRYDLVYRRGGGAPGVPPVVARLGGGWLVRSVTLGVAAALDLMPAVLLIGTCWLALVYIPESVRAGALTRRGARSEEAA